MLNIDLKARLKNKAFYVSMVGAIILLAQKCGFDATTIIPKNYADIINTIFVILTMVGIVVDTSTTGVNDQTSATSSTVVTVENSTQATEDTTTDTSASAKIAVVNPDNIQEIGATVNVTSAVAPN